MFQSSSYWIRAGRKLDAESIRKRIRFNPHLTGYGLEGLALPELRRMGTVSILILLDTGWKQSKCERVAFGGGFNPHLTGYGLEAVYKNALSTKAKSFNPHLTGYGLEVPCTSSAVL